MKRNNTSNRRLTPHGLLLLPPTLVSAIFFGVAQEGFNLVAEHLFRQAGKPSTGFHRVKTDSFLVSAEPSTETLGNSWM